MRRSPRLLCAAAAVALATSTLTALTSSAASAALPNCNQWATNWGSEPRPRIPTYGSGNWDCVLGSGNVSDGVWALQYTMRYCYGQNINVDKVFGAQTRSALINVQRQVGAAADGVYGPATRSRMQWARAAGPDNSCISVG
ncbi:peptidoglycan-binding protein [Micromonospora sp. NPDC018662]|uniref:peptidoglycan-binding protein n=1 Tax=Micromonospora sp. NPDC018662 TaxID=3364238 RepID=UPI0037B7B541